MGNHSDTGELLEEAKMIALTERTASLGDTLYDELGNAIKLDQSPDNTKPANPTKLKDSSGRDVEMISNELPGERPLTLKQYEALEAKRNKKKKS